MSRLRHVVPVTAVALALAVLSGCTSSGDAGGSPAARNTTSHSTASSKPASKPAPNHSGFTPSIKAAPDDAMPGYDGTCQVSQHSIKTKLCTFGDTSDPALTIAMVGDSVANEWLPGVVAAGRTRHWKIVTDYHSRCPWSATMTINSGETAPYTACHTWGENAMQDILTRIKPDLVITSDRPVLGTVANPTPGPAALAEIGQGMATYWQVLLDHHIAVVPIRESPEMGFDVPECLAAKSVSACTVPAGQAITPDPPTVVAARALGDAVKLIDMNSVICPDDTCKPVAGRIIVYRDPHHLTYTYVHSIAAKLTEKLLATGAFGPR